MDNVAICMGKSIFTESREKQHFKICLPYKIPIIFFNLDLVVQYYISFKDISHLELR